MNQELMDTCRAEIEDLLKKGIIRKSRSPWSCPAFYVQKNAEIERGVPRLVINYKPLNKVLEWVRYPIPNKKDLVNRLSKAVVFSKFDMKSGFWQIQIREPDRLRTNPSPWTPAHTTIVQHIKQVTVKMSGKKLVQQPLPQPPKLSEQQNPGDISQSQTTGKIVPITPSQIILKNLTQDSPASPSIIANRYLVSTIPKPNYERPPYGQPSYSSALASPAPKAANPYQVEEHFSHIQTQRPSSYQTQRGQSSYFKKTFTQHISYIEPHLVHITDPLALAMEVLPPNWHFLPKHPEKNIQFYKSILSQEKSAQIENIYSKGDPSIVLYHKFIITGFVNCKEWEQHPSLLRILRNYRSPSGSVFHYSYYDYMDAFEKVLFFQNHKFNHSWFLMFSKDFVGQTPSWFLKWWEMFGSIPQIFPEPLQDALRYFDSRCSSSKHRSYNLLNREFLVKWWDSLRINPIINQVYKDYPPPVQKPIAYRTRSQSSLDSVQFTGKSSKELKELAQQLMAHSQQLESEERVSPTTSEGSVNHDPIDPFQDSQDPYSGYNLDSD
ncbi:hypothetical protein ACB092_01G324700 [Castanea dentata]